VPCGPSRSSHPSRRSRSSSHPKERVGRRTSPGLGGAGGSRLTSAPACVPCSVRGAPRAPACARRPP
jgi:hypothetical protein